ncbi:polysaccharide biosynthesis tyrosine autokinase [Pseudidiomarina sp. PP-1MA]|uniref:Polysaccharide biosynthesis tyrosine autokinase n=1 Tax=Pseudidiomarina sp. PP-1MA TaxID=3237706 RepID=A0AB39XAU0_9GAMM
MTTTKTSSQPINKVTDDAIDIGRFIGIIIDNKKLLIAAIVISTLVGYLVATLSTPIYRADALIQIEKKQSSIPGLDMAAMFRGTNETEAEAFILRSRMVAGPVVERLGLNINVQPQYMPFIGEWLARRSGKPDSIVFETFNPPSPGTYDLVVTGANSFEIYQFDELLVSGKTNQLLEQNGFKVYVTSLEANNTEEFKVVKTRAATAINRLANSLRVIEMGTRTGILEVSLQNPDRQSAERTLNAVIEEYQLQNIRRSAAEAQNSLKFLQEQMPEVKATLDSAEAALNSYRISAESIDLQTETQSLLERIVELDKVVNELEAQESEISRLFTKEHPSYQALLEQKTRVLEERGSLSERVQGLPETQQKILRLMRDVEVSQQIYLQLLNRMQELNIAKASTVGNVRILDAAQATFGPVAPQKSIIIVVAFLLGAFGSITWVLVRALLNKGIERPEQLEEEGLNVYASVPLSDAQRSFNLKLERFARSKDRQTQHMPLLAKEDPTDLAIEALRGLRTSLHFAMLEAKNNILMITGPSPAVGKTFVTANLAAVLAQSGKKVLVIDADIRRGYMHSIFNTSNDYGLSNFLADKGKQIGEFKNVIKQLHVDNLFFLPRGEAAPNPSELLMHDRMQALLELCQHEYDYVIVDTPPVLAVTDAAIVGRYVGTTLLVARFGETPVKEVTTTVQRLAQNGVDVKGIILNSVERKASAYYGYGYSYGYQYGYSYKSEKS